MLCKDFRLIFWFSYIKAVSEDFSIPTELEYKGKMFKSASSASKEMYREYAQETGEVVEVTSNGFEDLKYQVCIPLHAMDWLTIIVDTLRRVEQITRTFPCRNKKTK